MPSSPRDWESSRRGQSSPRTVRSFLYFALGSLGTFIMAARAVGWLGGPPWLVLVFVAAGLVLAGYYLVRLLLLSGFVRRLRSGRR